MHRHRYLANGKFILLLLLLAGCASFDPHPLEEVRFQDRAQTQTEAGLRVTAAVLSAEETQQVFDLDLYRKGIQPIWLEIENSSDETLWILPVGIDKDYFPPLEVAYMHHFTFSKSVNQRMDRYFFNQGMGTSVPAGSVRSGYVFTNLDLGTKAFNVDLIGAKSRFRSFSFFIAVPGFRSSHQDVDFYGLYSTDAVRAFDDSEDLRRTLEQLPCCTSDADGAQTKEPLNLVIIGKGRTVHRLLIRRGWNETERTDNDSSSMENLPFIVADSYRFAPVSLRYLFGRPQDAAFRKSRETAGERNHLRLWLAPIKYRGQPVWVGQISREIKVRYLPNLYRLEPLVDEARTYILQDLWYSQGLAQFGYVKGVGAAPLTEQHFGFFGDLYATDGYRAVLWISDEPTALNEVIDVDWETPGPARRQ